MLKKIQWKSCDLNVGSEWWVPYWICTIGAGVSVLAGDGIAADCYATGAWVIALVNIFDGFRALYFMRRKAKAKRIWNGATQSDDDTRFRRLLDEAGEIDGVFRLTRPVVIDKKLAAKGGFAFLDIMFPQRPALYIHKEAKINHLHLCTREVVRGRGSIVRVYDDEDIL